MSEKEKGNTPNGDINKRQDFTGIFSYKDITEVATDQRRHRSTGRWHQHFLWLFIDISQFFQRTAYLDNPGITCGRFGHCVFVSIFQKSQG